MTPVLKKVGALALSLGTLGALVTHAAITGCKPSAAPAVSASPETTSAANAEISAPRVASSAVVSNAATPSASGPAPSAATMPTAPAGPSTHDLAEPEWLPASKAGPVFRPKGTPAATAKPEPQPPYLGNQK